MLMRFFVLKTFLIIVIINIISIILLSKIGICMQFEIVINLYVFNK